MILDWPKNLIVEQQDIPEIIDNVASSGSSITGVERFVVTQAGRWRFGLKVSLYLPQTPSDLNRIMSWKALMALVQGKANMIRVPVYDAGADILVTSGFNSLRQNRYDIGVPHSDDSYHSDGSGYETDPCATVAVNAVPAGGTSIQLTFPTGMVPMIGHFFSDQDRLYRITNATLVSGTTYDISFQPRLRDSVSAGHYFSFTKLSCIARFSSETFQSVQQSSRLVSEIELNFTEALL